MQDERQAAPRARNLSDGSRIISIRQIMVVGLKRTYEINRLSNDLFQ